MGGWKEKVKWFIPLRLTARDEWSIPLRHGDTAVAVTGTITWVPGQSAVPWLLVAAALAVGVVLLSRLEAWGELLSVIMAVLIAVDVVHAVGLAMYAGRGGADVLVRLIGGSYLSIGAWAAGVAAIDGLQRGREGGLFAACFAAAVIAVLSGFTDLTVLTRSQIPNALPVVYGRVAVVSALGLGLGVAASAGRRMVRSLPAPGAAQGMSHRRASGRAP